MECLINSCNCSSDIAKQLTAFTSKAVEQGKASFASTCDWTSLMTTCYANYLEDQNYWKYIHCTKKIGCADVAYQLVTLD